jgi:hypothetical protein
MAGRSPITGRKARDFLEQFQQKWRTVLRQELRGKLAGKRKGRGEPRPFLNQKRPSD